MANDKEPVPEFISKGQLYRQIEQLPGDQRELVLGADQATREKIMALAGSARDAAIDALRPKPEAPPPAETKSQKKGE